MDAVPKRVLKYLTEVEEAAEDVLTTRQQVIKYFLGNNKLAMRGRAGSRGSTDTSVAVEDN